MIELDTMTRLLTVLNSMGGYPARESVIYGQFNASQPDVQTMTSLREHLQHAKDKGWTDYIVDEIDRAKKWFITPEGKTLLANQR